MMISEDTKEIPQNLFLGFYETIWQDCTHVVTCALYPEHATFDRIIHESYITANCPYQHWNAWLKAMEKYKLTVHRTGFSIQIVCSPNRVVINLQQ